MAVVEIAKIQIRRGDVRSIGMPQLDTGELGWAISGTNPNSVIPELYVGNKQVDGATADANVRILTSDDLNIFKGASVSTSTFIYSGNKTAPGGTGAIIKTGDVSTDVVRTVEQKLNDIVSAADFGVFPDDDTTTTATALQRAVDQLFLNSDKYDPGARAVLVIPQGNYAIDNVIYVPSYATIVGAGKDKTIITQTATGQPIFQYIDQSSTPGSRVTLNGMQSNTAPTNITIKGLTLQLSIIVDPASMVPLIRADCASDSDITEVVFRGRTNLGYNTTNLYSAGIEIRGLGGVNSRNLRIRDCLFEILNCGIMSNYDVEDTIIENNKFNNLYRGIVFGKNLQAGQSTGPKRSKINRNVFLYISQQAVSVEPVSSLINTDHITSQNTFYDVGNGGISVAGNVSGDLNNGQVTEIIKFGTFGNVSDNDYFDRNIQVNSPTAISSSTKFINPISGHASIVDNKIRVVALTTATVSGIFLKLAGNPDITNINIQYHMTLANNTISRWGNLYIVVAAGGVQDITDTYRSIGYSDGGIFFNATYDDTISNGGKNTITITYYGNGTVGASPPNGLSGQITYQYNQYY
jgi:hypothetical protein